MVPGFLTVLVVSHVIGAWAVPSFVNAIAGLLFGLGLLISGMADPAKVQNFLNRFGAWDARFGHGGRRDDIHRLSASAYRPSCSNGHRLVTRNLLR